MNNLNKKILIVEVEKSLLLLLQEKFESEGFSVVTAQNGKEGLIAVEKEKPDIILLDIVMPEMDGITMAHKLKDKNSRIPMIFLTNLSDLEDVSKALKIGLSDYLVKSERRVDEVVVKVKEKLGLK